MDFFVGFLKDSYFITLFLTGIIFWFTGLIVKSNPPKKINHFYGYRTKRSMKSQDAWDFAQQHSMELMINLGVFYMVSSIIGPIMKWPSGWGVTLSMIVIFGGIGYLLYQVETALKEKFEK